MLRIQFPSLSVFGAPYRDGDPTGFYVQKRGLIGWDGSPLGRREAVERPFQHGEYDLPVFRGPRVLTLKGYAIARSEFELGMMTNLLGGVGASGGAVALNVDYLDRSQSARARVLSLDFTDSGIRGNRPWSEFTMEMVCADPRKYGESRTFRDEAASHRGNFPATPRLRVSGVREAGWTVTGPSGRRVSVDRPLIASAPHEIDLATGALIVGGSSSAGGLVLFEPWTIPVATNVAHSVSSGLTLDVILRDTYM